MAVPQASAFVPLNPGAPGWDAFQQGVSSIFRQWMVLRLAVENEWGGGQSERKAELMLEELLGLFTAAAHKSKDVYRDEVEDQLAIFLDEQFQTVAEDGSLEEVSQLVISMFHQCMNGDTTLVQQMLGKEQQAAGLRKQYTEMSRAASGARGEGVMESDDEEDEEEVGHYGRGGSDGSMAVVPQGILENQMMGKAPVVAGGMTTQGGGDCGMDIEGGDEQQQQQHHSEGPDEEGWETVPTRNTRRSGRRRAPVTRLAY